MYLTSREIAIKWFGGETKLPGSHVTGFVQVYNLPGAETVEKDMIDKYEKHNCLPKRDSNGKYKL